ncbi:MAG: hypothetical protein KAJ10_03520, partial [Thermodesulfovibrionia bacterium]|nr:hypothetical protein [Thermodesulfovibrionia bacterium]
KNEIIEAVLKKKFNIYAIDNIEDGIKILTGLPPGELKPDGTYPEKTFNFLVAKKLKELSDAMKEEKESDDNNRDKKKSGKKGKKPRKQK